MYDEKLLRSNKRLSIKDYVASLPSSTFKMLQDTSLENLHEWKGSHRQLLKKMNKIMNTQSKITNPKRLGKIMNLIRTKHPQTQHVFFSMFYEIHDSIDINKMIEDSLKFIPNCSYEDALNSFFSICFLSFWEGEHRENYAKRFLYDNFENVNYSSKVEDNKYKIDFFVTMTSGKRIGFQIKPQTFLTHRISVKVNIQDNLKAIQKGLCSTVVYLTIDNGRVTNIYSLRKISKISYDHVDDDTLINQKVKVLHKYIYSH